MPVVCSLPPGSASVNGWRPFALALKTPWELTLQPALPPRVSHISTERGVPPIH